MLRSRCVAPVRRVAATSIPRNVHAPQACLFVERQERSDAVVRGELHYILRHCTATAVEEGFGVAAVQRGGAHVNVHYGAVVPVLSGRVIRRVGVGGAHDRVVDVINPRADVRIAFPRISRRALKLLIIDRTHAYRLRHEPVERREDELRPLPTARDARAEIALRCLPAQRVRWVIANRIGEVEEISAH